MLTISYFFGDLRVELVIKAACFLSPFSLIFTLLSVDSRVHFFAVTYHFFVPSALACLLWQNCLSSTKILKESFVR